MDFSFLRGIGRMIMRAGSPLSKRPPPKPGLAAQQAFLRRNDVNCIFDVGASDGPYTFECRGLFPNAQVWAFEALGKHFKELVGNSRSDPAIRPYHLAISDVVGPVMLNVNQLPHTSSILPGRSKTVEGAYRQFLAKVGEERVDSVTLDHFAESNHIQAIDILKMDIQGAELRALMGARRLLAERRIKLIYCEVNFREFYDDQPLFADIAKYLHSLGYRFADVYNREYQGNELQWADAIFLSPGIEVDLAAPRVANDA